jgi:hypothetical protein
MDISAFLKTLWATPVSGYITLTFLPASHATDTAKPSLHFPVADIVKLDDGDVEFFKSKGENLQKNTYFGLAARRSDLGEKRRGVKKDCVALPGFCVDIDIHDPRAHKAAATTLPKSQDEAASLLVGYPTPSLVIDSGFGLHCYWLFDKPLLFAPGAYGPAEAQMSQFVAPLLARAQEKGWRLDACDTIDRVWRVPGFLNHKVKEEPRRVEVLVDTGDRYRVTDLLGPSTPPLASPTGDSSRPSESLPEQGPVVGGKVLPAAPVAVTEAFANEVRAFCAKLVRPERRELLSKVMAGESFAVAGDRDRLLQVVCSVLAWIPPGRTADPALLAEFLRPSLTLWANEPDAKLPLDAEMSKAVDKISRAQRDYDTKQARALDAIRKTLMRGRKEPETAPAGGDPEPVEEDEKAYILKHSVIQYRGSYYVFNFAKERYSFPKTEQELPIVLSNYWSGTDVPIVKTYLTAKGDVAEKTMTRLLTDYGTNVDRVILDLTIQSSIFEAETQIFREAAAPRRPLVPTYDAEVDEWLKAFGGAQADRLQDWLACVTRLEEPICALYIGGQSGVGKGLLASGLARIYTQSTPVKMENVVGTSFNEEITSCPIIHADEGLPKGVKGISEILRSLISGHEQVIKRKHLPSVAMNGALRLIITANSDTALNELGNEDFSLEDLDAVAGRFLYIWAGIDGNYLKDRVKKNPRYLHRWIKGEDALARHILWLTENRQVVRQGRFLVEGEMAPVHQQILTSGGTRGLVLEWLARFLDNPVPVLQRYKGQEARVKFDEGETLINTQAVVDGWNLYVSDKRPTPTTASIGRNLRLLSKREGTLDRRGSGANRIRFHAIQWDIVLTWARQNQIGDLSVMEQRAKGISPLMAV